MIKYNTTLVLKNFGGLWTPKDSPLIIKIGGNLNNNNVKDNYDMDNKSYERFVERGIL